MLQQETYDLVPVMFNIGLGIEDALVPTDSFHFIMETYSKIPHHWTLPTSRLCVGQNS